MLLINNVKDHDDYSRSQGGVINKLKTQRLNGGARFSRGGYKNLGNRVVPYNQASLHVPMTQSVSSTSVVVPGRNQQQQAAGAVTGSNVVVPMRSSNNTNVNRGAGNSAGGNRLLGPCYGCGHMGHLVNNCPF